MTKHGIGIAVVVGILLLTVTPSLRADLLGQTISGCTNTAYGSTVTTSAGACAPQASGFSGTAMVVDPGIEFSTTGGVGSRDVDFTGNTVSLIYGPGQGSASADLFVFTGLNLPGGITGLTLLTGNPLDVTVAFTADAIGLLVNSPECCTTASTTVTYQILYQQQPQVPEPATLGLVGIGLLGMGRRLLRMR